MAVTTAQRTPAIAGVAYAGFTASAISLAVGSLAALCGIDWSGGRAEVQA